MTESFSVKRWQVLAGIAGLAMVLAALPTRMRAQVATTTVQGTIYRADGSAATGTVLVSWPTFSTSTNQAVAAGSTTAIIGQDGFVSLNLAPNLGAYPAGSYYTAVYHLNDGTVSKEYWVVPAATTATISAIRAQLAPATVAVQSIGKSYVDSSIAAIAGEYLPITGGAMSGTLVLEGDPTAGSQAATKHYVDALASTDVPLAGGNMSGTLNTPNNVNKLSRVDVRHPDFGVGCPNAADPTGQQDSTCAIQAAIAWSEANPQGHTYPDIYLAAGTYVISSTLYVPCQMHFVGDGPQASILEPTNNSANAIAVYPLGVAIQPNLWTCNGSLENLSIHALGGHLYTATLVELQNAVGYTISRVRGSNGGGRGLALVGSTERLKAIDTEWDTIRWPIVATGNELKFLDTQIASPGVDAIGYCMAPNNCVNGVYPGLNWTGTTQSILSASGSGGTATYVVSGSPTIAAGGYFTVAGLTGVTSLNGTFRAISVQANTPATGQYTLTANSGGTGSAGVSGATIGTQQTLVSASANGSIATFVVQGGSDAAGSNGISPIVAGHWFTISGIPDLTGLNGVWQVATVSNNAPSSGQYTVTARIPANGTATVTNASFKPTILPENHSAFYMSGAAISVLGGSIKALWYAGCFQATSVFSGLIEGFYCEGYPINGQPHLNANITEVGLPFTTTLTGAISNNAAPVASTSWAPAYVNSPNDISAAGGGEEVRILPPDWLLGSTAPSAYVPGVQRGQYEIAYAVFSGDGQAHFKTRNFGGTVSLSNVAWPSGSIVAEIPQPSYGTLTVKASHLSAINPPPSGGSWAGYCNDTNFLICANTIAGPIPNGYTTFTNSQVAGGGGEASLTFEGDEWWGFGGSANEPYGQLFVKVLGSSRITVTNGGSAATSGETSEVATGQYLANSSPSVVAVQYGDGSSGWVSYSNPQQGTYASNIHGPFYESMVDSSGDPVLGANPNSSWALGHQFAGSSCSYDTPPSGQAHSTYRFCMKGGPGNTAANAGWEYDIWNGSSWVNALGISGQSNSTANLRVTGATEVQGVLTASSINGEVTVDGVTYPTLIAAWNAAYALANSTGKNQTVRLGPGTFAITATLTEPANGACVSLLGSGGTTVNAGSSVATTLNVTTNLTADVFYLGNAAQAQGCTFKDFVLLAAGNATHGFELQWFRGLLIDNVTVNDTTAEGILLGEETGAHQANFLLRNVTVSYNAALFTPANRPAYGIHLQKTAIDSHLDDIVVRNALIAGVYNEGTGNTGYLIHGFGYPYTCTTAPCVNNAATSSAANASYATNYVIYDVGGAGSIWTDTYADSPAVAGFYVGANGVAVHGGHIQWPDLTSFPAANLAYVAAGVSNNMLIADVDCLGMNSGVNWITYAGTAGNPPTFTSVHHLTGCGNYSQSLEPAQVTGFSSGGANINDPSGAVPRVWATPIAAASSYPAFSAQLYTGYQGDIFQGHFSGVTPFFNITYQGTIRSNGGIALNTVLNTASTLTLTNANKNVIVNAASGAQTLTLPSCFTPLVDNASPTGLEFTIIKSDTSANAVTLQTVSSQNINYAGTAAQTLAISAAGKRTLVCGPDFNWYAY
ncbi:MAG TPA: glycosyl hydrolase family 28-related protein [Silvibacterium sp.]|nr:glycosyl hydrolase family 28-related protein [Silvibacterium sp.]